MNFSYAKQPKFSSEDDGMIDLIVKFDEFNEEVPFTANINDVMSYGRELYAKAMNGEFGEIEPYAPLSNEELASIIRSQRDFLLSSSDWSQFSDVPDEIKTSYVSYRQALRDIPQQIGFPTNITWPVKPE